MTTTVQSFEELQANVKDGITIVDFYADWCGPCKALAPTLNELTNHFDDKIKVVKINVDENAELARNYQVRGIPALFFFKEGEVKGSATGNLPLQELKNRVNQLL